MACKKLGVRLESDMRDHLSPEYIFVEKEEDLSRRMPELQGERTIGVDLEADSMFHYQEKVCLIQIATARVNLLIDPLTVKDLSPLIPIFADRQVRKVFHGADYDIRSLHRDFGIEVTSLFDTQIAARFLGVREISLASLIKTYFDLSIDKKYQKKDWSRRPLPEPMMAYAAQDIGYLLPLSRILEKELKKRGRLFCVKEECELLTGVRSQTHGSDPLFASFKGAGRLDGRGLAILEGLLQFRDQMARRRDYPHFKVLGNAPILDIAQHKPRTRGELSSIEGLNARLIGQMGDTILEKVREALRVPENALPVYPKKPWGRLNSRESNRVKALKAWRDRMGVQWDVDPSVICTNAQIQEIAIANPQNPRDLNTVKELRKWQVRLFGHDICHVLRHSSR